ncbi:MAG: hypothetical protein OQK01_04070, partial [Xanthomonadales bacterium]|nr:hypothetical protein [Xanthomonadales bacterium]
LGHADTDKPAISTLNSTLIQILFADTPLLAFKQQATTLETNANHSEAIPCRYSMNSNAAM